MGNIVFGFLLLVMGLIFLIFNKAVTEWHIESHSTFGLFHFNERSRVITRIIYIIGGAIFTAVGAIDLLRVLSFI